MTTPIPDHSIPTRIDHRILPHPGQKRVAARQRHVEVGRRVAPRVRVAFEVDDATTTTRRLVDAGAELVAEPTRTPGRR
jgi:hypothetical protein